MAIIRCHECGRRISSLAKVCPHCDAVMGELTPEELDLRQRRRFRRLLFRARMVTFVAMGLVIVGMLGWWVSGEQGLNLPPSPVAVALMATGLLVYLGGWGWLFWLRLTHARRRGAH